MSSWVNVFVFKHLYWGIIAQHKNHLPWLYNFMNFSLLRSYTNVTISSVQLLSRVWDFATPWTVARQGSLSLTNSQSLLKLMSIESGMPSNCLLDVVPFSCLQSFPASRPFPLSQFFTSGGQSIEVPASASVLPMNIQDSFPLGFSSLISLQSKGLNRRIFSNTTVQKHQFFTAQLSLWSNSHIHTWLLEKSQLWIDGPLSARECLFFLIRCLALS